jgi:hypothetical protein
MSGSYIPEDISALVSSPIEHFRNTKVAILEGDKFTNQALNLMKERDIRIMHIYIYIYIYIFFSRMLVK